MSLCRIHYILQYYQYFKNIFSVVLLIQFHRFKGIQSIQANVNNFGEFPQLKTKVQRALFCDVHRRETVLNQLNLALYSLLLHDTQLFPSVFTQRLPTHSNSQLPKVIIPMLSKTRTLHTKLITNSTYFMCTAEECFFKVIREHHMTHKVAYLESNFMAA